MIYPFLPSTQAAFQFQPTLDGEPITVQVTWSLFGQRYYLNAYSSDGTRVFTEPLIGSPDTGQINLIGPYFTTSTMYFSIEQQAFIVEP